MAGTARGASYVPLEPSEGENKSSNHNAEDNRLSTASYRAKAFVKTMSNQESQSMSPPRAHSYSISLDLMGSDRAPRTSDLISPATETSMRLNYSSESVRRLQLNLSPLRSSGQPTRGSATPPISTPEARAMFEYVAYQDVDSEQKIEFEKLLKKESGCARSWLHKGLVVNLLFLAVLVVGVVLGEVFFPLEGVRGRGITLMNDTRCTNDTPGCFTVRIVRAVGIFGFLGGVTNWIAIEMLFRSIPFLFGTGVFYKKYREIRSRLKRMVIEVLFDPAALKLYFTRRGKNLREIFELENHFGGLLDSDTTSKLVDKKIDYILARPEGLVLQMMGVDQQQLKATLREHIQSFIMEVTPTVLDKISSSGLSDGVGLQAEVERILEERTEELTATKVRQLMSAMIRKHLNWLIVWGNVLGAAAGLVAEIIALVVARYTES